MQRACKVTLKFVTAKKRRAISALLNAYRSAVNFYVKSLWAEPGGLNKETLARLQRSRLSARYRSQALRQALSVVVSTKLAAKATGKPCSRPVFRGPATLDAKFVEIVPGEKSFDLVIKLSTLAKGTRLVIPTRHTRVSRKWLAVAGAKLVQGCSLSANGVTLWVEVPKTAVKPAGKVLAVDVGVNKLLTDSDGQFYGQTFKQIRNKILRRKPGSRRYCRALVERDQFINRTVKQLPWASISTLGVEALHDMKRGKKKNRGKSFRRAMAPWTYRHVLARIGQLAEENRVRLLSYDPAYTSRTCPICGAESEGNRKGDAFLCTVCGHADDADTVGAQNGLAKTLTILGSLESPGLLKLNQ